jgi:hypothetical protein
MSYLFSSLGFIRLLAIYIHEIHKACQKIWSTRPQKYLRPLAKMTMKLSAGAKASGQCKFERKTLGPALSLSN